MTCAEIMKMMSNTSSTSTSGVMLMLAMGDDSIFAEKAILPPDVVDLDERYAGQLGMPAARLCSAEEAFPQGPGRVHDLRMGSLRPGAGPRERHRRQRAELREGQVPHPAVSLSLCLFDSAPRSSAGSRRTSSHPFPRSAWS